jgi:hypothetical protein
MGREIRRVPPDWEHPKRDQAWEHDYIPMHDQTYLSALAEWQAEKAAFDPTDTSRSEHGFEGTFEEWHGEAPDRQYYRPAWPDETRTALQIYETVSEGTPISPVFKDKDELVAWLVLEGYSEEAARKFAEMGHVPSMMMVGGKLAMGIAALEPGFLPEQKEE